MIDENGYRANVGIILADGRGRVFWARRIGQNAWQFPQGGVGENETAEEAMYRELHEEIGLSPNDVTLKACTKGWLRYRLPKRLIRYGTEPLCVGQKQKWFLLELNQDESAIRLDLHAKPEFDHWQWVSYWYPIEQVVSFKRDVYRRAMKELAFKHNEMVKGYLKAAGV